MPRRASTSRDLAGATSRRAGTTRRRIGGCDELSDAQRLLDVFERGADTEPEHFWDAARAVRELQARRAHESVRVAELRTTSRSTSRPRGAT